MELTTTNKGKACALYEGYSYNFKRINSQGVIFWRCSKERRNPCRGVMKSLNGLVLGASVHQCGPPDEVRLEVKKTLQTAKKRAREEDTAVSKIYKQELGKLHNKGYVKELPTQSTAKRLLYQVRCKSQGNRAEPEARDDGHHFLLADDKIDEKNADNLAHPELPQSSQSSTLTIPPGGHHEYRHESVESPELPEDLEERREDIPTVFIKEEPIELQDNFLPSSHEEEQQLPLPSALEHHPHIQPTPLKTHKQVVQTADPLGLQQPPTNDDPLGPEELMPLVDLLELERQTQPKSGPSQHRSQDNLPKISSFKKRQLIEPSHDSVPRKKARRQEESEMSKHDLVCKVVGMLEKKEDEFDIFAKHLAVKLRHMTPPQGTYAEKLITQVLYQGLFGKLQENTTIVNPVQRNKSGAGGGL